MILSAK
jgi:hypothetical protein